ncbi:OsmC family peroxiredoxin [Miltoncostaea marina]|uniref:OsmC family peroxiredoxin n=1 Tax=Miltoncostaea marina TaxID=2843215 RepID=UPI001C3D5113|nr:OsmC family peroxiredoxin [Miltoncostaea marina]
MPSADRRAEATWEGDLLKGSGKLDFISSGAASSLDITWASRVETADGRTSPEELLAAAHASCYAMAFSNILAKGGTPAERLHVTAVVSVNPKEGGGIQVTDSKLTVRGTVPGIDDAAFKDAAAKGEAGCPISNAIRGSVAISLDASLE